MATATATNPRRHKGGRHPLPDDARRQVRVLLALTQEESDIINEASRRDGLAVGQYMRLAALRRARFDNERG